MKQPSPQAPVPADSKPYCTVIVPWVPPAFRTEWHPDVKGSTFDPMSRGAFPTDSAAITWARAHLNGTPYSIKWYPPAEGEKCPHGLFWYAIVESENANVPVGSLDIDCDVCRRTFQ